MFFSKEIDSETPKSYAITYRWNLKKKDTVNFFAEQILTHNFENLWFPKETGWGVGRMGWGFGMEML